MPPRGSNHITMMIAQARQKLREIKQLQIFGGDALNLKRYRYNMVQPAGAAATCYRIVMTPTAIGTTMPIEVGSKPANATSFGSATVDRLARTDGQYEYLAYMDSNYTENTRTIEMFVIYSGAATFSVTKIA